MKDLKYKKCPYAKCGTIDARNYYLCKLNGECHDQLRVSNVATICTKVLRLEMMGVGAMDFETAKREFRKT
jgi:hypothetical protein